MFSFVIDLIHLFVVVGTIALLISWYPVLLWFTILAAILFVVFCRG